MDSCFINPYIRAGRVLRMCCPPVHIQYIYQPLDFYHYEQYAVCILTTILAPPYHLILLTKVNHLYLLQKFVLCTDKKTLQLTTVH